MDIKILAFGHYFDGIQRNLPLEELHQDPKQTEATFVNKKMVRKRITVGNAYNENAYNEERL